jgi:hypothetical protein
MGTLRGSSSARHSCVSTGLCRFLKTRPVIPHRRRPERARRRILRQPGAGDFTRASRTAPFAPPFIRWRKFSARTMTREMKFRARFRFRQPGGPVSSFVFSESGQAGK